MKPFGQKWTLEDVGPFKPSNIEISDYTWYAVMNMMYNDYYDIFRKSVYFIFK